MRTGSILIGVLRVPGLVSKLKRVSSNSRFMERDAGALSVICSSLSVGDRITHPSLGSDGVTPGVLLLRYRLR